jgi:TonB-dependent receptor
VKNFILLLLTTFFITQLQAQKTAKLSGKIVNENNEPVVGATIKVIGFKGGTTSNIDGNYNINLPLGKKFVIEITAIGFNAKKITDVEVFEGKFNEVNILLQNKAKVLDDVVVSSSSSRKESVNALISFQKNTNTVAQVVSAEAIRRSPDKNTGEVLKRVPGTSVQEGKYLVVRGLADRYNIAMLNGIMLGSTEPDRKTFSFDIFPSSIIDNIIINKAFVPELPGEWAGGLVQVNTKDIPSKNFFNVQFSTGFNTQTVGHDFYKYQGGKFDFLGFDDGTRAIPNGVPLKNSFSNLDQTQKTEFGKQFANIWSTEATNNQSIDLLSKSFQISGGFTKNIGKKNKLGAVLALNYNISPKRLENDNRIYSITNTDASLNFDYYNQKYSRDVLMGALANFTLQLGNNSKISLKNILNVNTSNYATKRTGKDFENDPINGENIRATELAFKANTFYNVQLLGEHKLPKKNLRFKWFGSFNILDQYIPDQRRIQYNQNVVVPNSPYLLLISASKTSQKSGSRYFGSLSDYIYSAGGDVSKNFELFNYNQTLKLGYLFQVKDRLFDSRPFAIYLPSDNVELRKLNESVVFSAENFGNGFDNKFAFNEIYGDQYRYLANTILNAAYVQFDNQFNQHVKASWGVRMEHFDQLVGSVYEKDPRHVRTVVNDFLPGVNITYKLNNLSNIRLSGSQTVIRPEFRELSPFAFFDFDLGATVTGNKTLERTKVTNFDLRYELYPRAGEIFTVGIFYKQFKNPIELFFNQTGAGSSSTFNYINADKAEGYGAELEFRKKLDFSKAFENFTIQSNVSYIYNRVTSAGTQLNRPMQGQSPFLINASIQYDLQKIGLNTTLLFNRIGRRILYVGNNDFPPVWENPRSLLDLQIAKKIMKDKAELKLNFSDILNQTAYYYHDINDNGKYDAADATAIRRKYGSNISISFSYNIK